MMDFNREKLFHIGLTPGQGAAYAIITGDPGRVESIARRLNGARFEAQNREFTTWSGQIDAERVLVTSHGIGGPSTAICVEELARCGVKTLIRVGTCGGMALTVQGGDVVVATGAIRMEGTSREYLPVEFPAVADFTVTGALAAAARKWGATVHVGVVQCKDSFYGQHSPEDSPVSWQLENAWSAWIKGGCLASEMESAALFVVAAAKGLRAGCVLQALWNQEREKAGLPNVRAAGADTSADIAIEALAHLMEQDRTTI